MLQLEEDSARTKVPSSAIDKLIEENERSSGKISDLHIELAAVKQSLSGAIEELKKKERYIESLKIELGKAKELEVKSVEKEASFCKLKKELKKVQSFESEAMGLVSEGKKRIHELEEEIKRRKESGKKIHDSYVAQTKEFERTKVSLEESRHVITSFHENLEKMEGNSSEAASQSSVEDDHSLMDGSESELQSNKESLVRAQEKERAALLKANILTQEVNLLKYELKSTREAEENNLKAMDDLAFALKEMRTEANEAKEELSVTKYELEKSREELELLKMMLTNIQLLYNEAKGEADVFKNTSERLKLEAEESHMAWNMKETGFVDCIKKLEDERNAAQEENKSLLESLKEAQNMYRKTMEENQKFWGSKKQAKNEANYVSKAVSNKKYEALSFHSQGNEKPMIKEATNFEIIREWKLLFCEEQSNKQKPLRCTDQKEQQKDGKEANKKAKQQKSGTPCLNLKFPHKSKDAEEDIENLIKDSDGESDSELFDPLRGSIFDEAETPKAASPIATRHQSKPSFAANDESNNGEEFYPIDSTNFDEENDKTTRKKKALLSRFSELIKIRTFN
ncbi:hypothetical protein ES332_A11G230800v1 [Gossypium tomentosum]|uniref:Uncharacterized protein n=1 Tax=Gossypium tomentosum TaxID=34277 RepID=A0A5D2NCV3_GOSTO|nr:hypothetical protein ES332_A11G230800v1 [Gossypium tomentosum]